MPGRDKEGGSLLASSFILQGRELPHLLHPLR